MLLPSEDSNLDCPVQSRVSCRLDEEASAADRQESILLRSIVAPARASSSWPGVLSAAVDLAGLEPAYLQGLLPGPYPGQCAGLPIRPVREVVSLAIFHVPEYLPDERFSDTDVGAVGLVLIACIRGAYVCDQLVPVQVPAGVFGWGFGAGVQAHGRGAAFSSSGLPGELCVAFRVDPVVVA